MNNYYVNIYLQSGISFFAGGRGGQLSGPTGMKVEPSLRLVLGQGMKVNGENITAIEAYKVDKLELIGIAKHDAPVAYVINRHPPYTPSTITMLRGNNVVQEVPVTASEIRSLTDFEKSALNQIKAGKDVVNQPADDGSCIVIGAVRAQDACIQCHSGFKVGDALGAFSYHLSKVNLFEN